MKRLRLYRFAKWVASEVCREDFADSADFFAEVCCRKLNELGIVKKDGENWVYDTKAERAEA